MMIRILTRVRHYLFLSLILFSAVTVAEEPPIELDNAAFQSWLNDFKPKAVEAGVSQSTVDKAFQNLQLNERVLELDRRQPEFTRTFWQYFNRTVTNWRIEQGQKLYEKYKPLLTEVTKKYGVPERFLISFWGMETNFGGYTGNTPIIESLATLAYDPRRSEFFQTELIAALKILDQGNVTLDSMKGSWAGAMGQCQFMPTNYLKYAVDADNSGKKDLWGSLEDVFYSMGNFLNALGWHREENWGREVKLPESFDLALADGKTLRPLSEWKTLGIQLADGRSLPEENMEAALLLPYDYRGPAFLVFHNFFVIKKWNRSDSYALAVGHLADRIIGRPALTKSQPRDDQALSREEIIEMQERLKIKGFYAGGLDGVAGSQTRQALRKFQTQHQLPIDGYPSYRMLKLLRKDG